MAFPFFNTVVQSPFVKLGEEGVGGHAVEHLHLLTRLQLGAGPQHGQHGLGVLHLAAIDLYDFLHVRGRLSTL